MTNIRSLYYYKYPELLYTSEFIWEHCAIQTAIMVRPLCQLIVKYDLS